MVLISDDLPQPLGPRMATCCPRGNGKCNRIESLVPVAEDGYVAEIDQRGGLVSRIGVGRHGIVGVGGKSAGR